MRKMFKILICMFLCVVLIHTDRIAAETNDTVTISHVYAEYEHDSGEKEKKDILFELMEIESGVMQSVHIDIDMTGAPSGYTCRIFQYDASTKKQNDMGKYSSASFDLETEDMLVNIPVYLGIYDSGGKRLTTRLLTIRVNQGRAQLLVTESIPSTFSEDITVDMDELLPGMNFAMHPYILPLTTKAFSDGRIVIGIGINSGNVNFWKDARSGKLLDTTPTKELSDAFWGNSENRAAMKGSHMGLIFTVGGWVQGNIHNTEPMKGELNAYIGTGFDVTGQYAILTWEVTVTGGADGILDFHLTYNEEKSRYENFEVDVFNLGFKTSLELYGGIGLSSIASAGIYGAGSIAGYTCFYPTSNMDALVLAGECGFKVKVFSRTIVSFALVSGSYDFVRKKKPKAMLNFNMQDDLGNILLSSDYGSLAGTVSEPESAGTWYTDGQEPYEGFKASINSYEEDSDFAHLVAEDIYPDNKLQVISTGSRAFPQMNVVFLGTDPSRQNGNRSRLMNFYFSEHNDFLSDPVFIGEDDGTADYDLYTYRSDTSSRTYLVWRNGTKQFDEQSSFSDIAANSEIWFAEHFVSGEWHSFSQVTDLSGTGTFAADAKVSDDSEGAPVVTYCLNSVDDPAGADTGYTHDICIARKDRSTWINEKAFSVTGAVTGLDSAWYRNGQCIAVSYYTSDADGNKTAKVELWNNGEKIWERENASKAEFLKNGSYVYLTWYEGNSLYTLSPSGDYQVSRLTPADMKIPDNNYTIYGKPGSSSIILIGTASKDSSENAYAVFSENGGITWDRIDLTDIEPNASVNEISVGYTYENEPVLFYSVQKYETNYPEEAADAETYLQGAEQNPAFAGLQAVMLGQDDARFTDVQTDLYVKARKANQKAVITDVRFEEDTARKGNRLPVTVDVENRGLYPIENYTVYANGEKISDQSAVIRPGEKGTVETGILIPADAPDEPLEYLFEVRPEDNADRSSTYKTTVGTGHISVKYTHELQYGIEKLRYTVTSHGFAPKTVTIEIYDEDTGERFHRYPLFVPAQGTASGVYTLADGLWEDYGHKNLRACILLPGETAEDLDSTRTVRARGLDKIYLQDISGLKDPAAATPTPEPSEEPTEEPTAEPTEEPAPQPTASSAPEPAPVPSPTTEPEPSAEPSPQPEVTPSAEPEVTPSEEPGPVPSAQPQETPASGPAETPDQGGTPAPSGNPDPEHTPAGDEQGSEETAHQEEGKEGETPAPEETESPVPEEGKTAEPEVIKKKKFPIFPYILILPVLLAGFFIILLKRRKDRDQ